MVVGLVPEAAAKVAWSLEAKIFKFLNRFPGTHTQTARELLAKDALGDLGGNVENWVKTRLRALGWLRGSQSRSYRLHTHVAKVMRDYKGWTMPGTRPSSPTPPCARDPPVLF